MDGVNNSLFSGVESSGQCSASLTKDLFPHSLNVVDKFGLDGLLGESLETALD